VSNRSFDVEEAATANKDGIERGEYSATTQRKPKKRKLFNFGRRAFTIPK
jgi:hypothetical protein